MGIQLIFVLETNKKCKSDWIYIKDTIEYFYDIDVNNTKFTQIYMDGKGNYKNKQKDINKNIDQYAKGTKNSNSIVIYCFDCDDYDINTEAAKFLEDAFRFCNDNKYELIWFCKDIERVYLKRKVAKNEKKMEAGKFKANKIIRNIDEKNLNADKYKDGTSNILNILDKYLVRKLREEAK